MDIDFLCIFVYNIYWHNIMKIADRYMISIPSGLLSKKTFFSRKVIYESLTAENKNISKNSFKWILAEWISKGLLYKISSDSYSMEPCTKKIYSPKYSKKTKALAASLSDFYPDVSFVIFESFLLNEFVNHLLAKNTIVIMVEKDMVDFVFEHLYQEYSGKVLLSPSQEEFNRYWTEDCIVIEKMVSESPLFKEKVHEITIEKFLVDCVVDKVISALFTHSEYEMIFEEANARYNIDYKKMKRYSKRRNCWEKIKVYLGDFANDI